MDANGDPREAAASRIAELLRVLEADPANATIAEECRALHRAIGAFHMEGIRFRIFNVDRLLATAATGAGEDARRLLEEARHFLEAAGFHTRSHQSPV